MWTCSSLFFFATIVPFFDLDASDAGECQVHNKPDYLKIASNPNEESSGQITVSDFANNLQTLLGLSSDQVDKILSSRKKCTRKNLGIRMRSLDYPTSVLFHSPIDNSCIDVAISYRRSWSIIQSWSYIRRCEWRRTKKNFLLTSLFVSECRIWYRVNSFEINWSK